MAGSRPSQYKSGGGFLNNVDARITGQEFTYQFGDNEPKRGEETKNIYSAWSFRQDGADEDVTIHLYLGGGEFGDNDRYFIISDDAKTLDESESDMELWSESPNAAFVNSLISADETGTLDDSLPTNEVNYQSLIGTRVRLVQVPELDKDTGKVRMRKVTKGKYKGKEFKQTTTQVAKVLALPGAKEEKGKSASRSNGSGGKSTAPVSKKSKKADEGAIGDEARDTLLAILEHNNGTVAKAKLPFKSLTVLGVDHPRKEEIRRLMVSDDFLSQPNLGWKYDKASKAQTITATEVE